MAKKKPVKTADPWKSWDDAKSAEGLLRPFAEYARLRTNYSAGDGSRRNLPDDWPLLEQQNASVTETGITLGLCREIAAHLAAGEVKHV